MIHRIIIAIVCIISFNSCINEIDFDEEKQKPVMVLNCLISPDSLVKANITYSRFFLLPDSDFVVVKNVHVNMLVNGILKEALKLKGSNYVSTYRPKSNDIISFEIYLPTTLKKVQAATTIPQIVKLAKVDSSSIFHSSIFVTHDTILSNQNTRTDTFCLAKTSVYDFEVEFKDAPDTLNYYRVAAILRLIYPGNKLVDRRVILYPNDPAIDRVAGSDIFDANSNRNFNIISDNLFDGRTYRLKLKAKIALIELTPDKILFPTVNVPKVPLKTELIFDLQAISVDLFEYLKTVKYNNTDLQYFSEPVQIYTNVQNGQGLLGSFTHSYFKFNLPVTTKTFYYQ